MTTRGRCEEGYPFPSPMIPCGTALIFRMLVVRHSLNDRSVSVSACLSERKSEWMCEMSVFVFLFFLFKKKPTQWSYLIWSEFGPALIGNDRKIACEPSWRWAAGESTNSRASTLYVVVRGDELIRYTSSLWVWVYLKSHGGHWV